jgi:hypothetical protein
VSSEIESAFTQKIQENRDQVTAELREEFAQRYAHDKGVIVEALDKMIGERLAAEMAELHEDKKQLVLAKTAYQSRIAEDAKKLEGFVIKQLGKELVEFQGDRKKVSENFQKLEQFIVRRKSSWFVKPKASSQKLNRVLYNVQPRLLKTQSLRS